ncbi:MerR family transcriptional regulator [uncultured Alistipes sp.]|jgi:DNA-binding transcriptional MerR regulator|uniref:MerR family transcriptional regulator n=1 Tax=uncultured Alistipes sp. TaxID=538949 RepID=UPI0025FA44D7|nr:MerR family transcriptional regulator [uncultured Alistipes sp.]
MSEKLYYSMGEVAEMFDVNQSLLRHWESQFPILRPKRNKKGNRLFTPQDVEHLKQIYHLVKECGMTLEGAKRAMRGQRAGKGVSRDVELMERLQRIRALLVEVREELKGDGESVMADADAADTAADSGLPAGTVLPAGTAPEPDVAAESGARPAAKPEAESAAGPLPEVAAGPEAEMASVQVVESLSGPAPETAPGPQVVTAAETETETASEVQAVPASRKRGRKAVVRIDEATGQPLEEAPSDAPGQPRRAARKPRRKKEEVEHKELFAFYEQSLF